MTVLDLIIYEDLQIWNILRLHQNTFEILQKRTFEGDARSFVNVLIDFFYKPIKCW